MEKSTAAVMVEWKASKMVDKRALTSVALSVETKATSKAETTVALTDLMTVALMVEKLAA